MGEDWNDEVAFCVNLVNEGGSKSVPPHLVAEYLNMQQKAAKRDGYEMHSHGLRTLLGYWLEDHQ